MRQRLDEIIDEIRMLSEAVNEMRIRINELTTEVLEIAQKTERLEGVGDGDTKAAD